MDKLQQKRNKYSILFFGLVAYHVFNVVMAAISGFTFLTVFNVVSVIVYVILGVSARSAHHFVKLFITAAVEAAAFLSVTQLLMGPDMGYGFINMAIIVVAFFIVYNIRHNLNRALIAASVVMTLFISITVVQLNRPGFECIPEPIIMLTIRIVNMFVAFALDMILVIDFVNSTAIERQSLQNANSDLETSANFDTLTGLRNRRSIDFYISNAFKDATCEGRDFSILMCDIDNFKRVNDTYGHDSGDLVLKNVAEQIKSAVRPTDIIFRWGGEEILILVDGGRYTAMKIGERCREAIENSVVKTADNTELKVTITIGCAPYYQGATREILIEKADDNLYKGKNNGKNQVVI